MSTGFCSECGRPKSNNERICANCEFDSGSGSGSAEYEANSKSGTSKRTKVIVGVVAGLLIALFSAHSYIKSMISPDEQIAAIYKALHKGDAKQLIEAIEIADGVIYDPQVYMDSLQYEDPAALREEITAAVQRTETMGLPQIISSDHIGDFIKVGQEKFLGVYKRVHITALDYEVKLETDLPSGEIAISKKEWKFEGKPISLGRFLPGTYVAVLSNESLAEGSIEENLRVQSNNQKNVYTFDKEDYMISFEGKNAEGFLLINGKETGEKVTELQEVGPFFTRELIELSLVQKIDGKSQHSDIVKAYPGEKNNFPIALQQAEVEEEEEQVEQVEQVEQEQQEEREEQVIFSEERGTEEDVSKTAEQFVLSFRSAYEEALNTRNFTLIAPYLKEGSVAYSEFAEFIGDMKNQNYRYDFIENNMKGTVIISNELVEVQTYEVFNFTNHLGEQTHYKREKTYDLLMSNNEEFEIYSIKISDTIRE